MKRTFFCCLACLILGGCNAPDEFIESLFGIKYSVVVLAPSALDISPTATTFARLRDAKVVGKTSLVCVVLAGNVSNERSQSEVDRLLGGAKLYALVTTSDGATHELTCQGMFWRLNGRIVAADEVASCVHPSCGQHAIPAGSSIREISVSSTRPLHALGVYWQSTSAFDGSDKP